MNTSELVQKIKDILIDKLPKQTFIEVKEWKGVFGGDYIKIFFSVSDYDINGVSGQKPQAVSLCVDLEDLELYPQIFGGNGGQFIYRKPNMEHPREKYLAMQSIKIPFRKPKPEIKFILGTIERFAENWLNALKDNKDLLMYQDIVDYDNYFAS